MTYRSTTLPTSCCLPDISFLTDHRHRRHLDVFGLVLLDSAANTLIPELYEVVGHDKETLIKLLEIFAGVTIKFPSVDVLKNAVRDATVFVELERSTDAGSDVKTLAKRYKIKSARVLEIYDHVCSVAACVLDQ